MCLQEQALLKDKKELKKLSKLKELKTILIDKTYVDNFERSDNSSNFYNY